MSSPQNLAERGMTIGLRALNRLAASDLLDRLGLRDPAERLLHGASKTTPDGRPGRPDVRGRAETVSSRASAAGAAGSVRPHADEEQQMLTESVRAFADRELRRAAAQSDSDCARAA